jgi:hypothetical protein
MTAKRSRGAISVRGRTYQRLQEHCSNTGATISGFLEKIIAAELDARGAPSSTPSPDRGEHTET